MVKFFHTSTDTEPKTADLDNVKAALEECPIFNDCQITIESGTGSNHKLLVITDSDSHRLFELHVHQDSLYIEAYAHASSSLYAKTWLGASSYPARIKNVYICDNGAIIEIVGKYNGNDTYWMPIRIVKTNDGRIAFISRRNDTAYCSGVDGYRNDIDCIAYGDVAPLSTMSISNRYDTHAAIVPMLTNCEADTVSYTEKSGFMTNSSQSTTIQVIEIAGDKYMTDGYFAIKVEES